MGDSGAAMITLLFDKGDTRPLRAKLAEHLDVTLWPHPGLSPLNRMSALLILISVLIFAFETEPTMRETPLGAGFRAANVLILLLFAAEYACRLWVAPENPRFAVKNGRWKMAATPFAVFDLLGFLPELLVLIVIAMGGASPENLAALKVLRFARLFRMMRYFEAANTVLIAMQRSWQQILSTFLISFMVLYILALMLFFLESAAQPEAYGSVLRSTYASAVQLTTLKGAPPPVTLGGKIISAVVAVLSLGVVALPAGIFANAFREVLIERRAELEAAKAAGHKASRRSAAQSAQSGEGDQSGEGAQRETGRMLRWRE